MVDLEKVLGERPQGCGVASRCGGCNYCGIESAIDVREESDHYSGYRVGAAILAIDSDGGLHIVSAANTYPSESDTHKACAESNVEAKFRKLQKVVGPLGKLALFVAASDDRERIVKVNGLEDAKTLHPCAGCREYFASDPSIDPNMPVYSCGVDESGQITVIEGNPIGVIWDMYSEVQAPSVSAQTTYNFDPSPAF